MQTALRTIEPNYVPIEEAPRLSDNQENALQFITAGNATFTVLNLSTGNRFTYKVAAPNEFTDKGGMRKDHAANVRFVSVLSGSDNESDYAFIGTVFLDTMRYWHSNKSRIKWNAPSAAAFKWTFERLLDHNLPDCVEIHHSGNCGRCGRKLTVPESIKSGFGPECIGKL